MARAADLAFLKLLCTSGIELLTQMPVLSDCIKRLVPSFSVSMVRVDETCAPAAHYSEYFDEPSHRLFAESGKHFSERSSDPAAFGNLLRNREPFGTLVHTPPQYLAGATYEHLFKRNGIHFCLDVALRDANGPLGILGFFREKNTRPFDAGDLATVRAIYGHLVHAMLASGAADAARPNAFEEVEAALLVVDANGTIQWASEHARAWLEDVAVRTSRKRLLDDQQIPEACRHLCTLWRANRTDGARRDRASGPVPSVALPVPGGRLRLRAYGLAASRSDGESGGLIGVQMSLEMHRDLRVLHALEQSTLTPQQRRVAFGMFKSRETPAICEEIGVSPSTLKSYQKDLYARLDVNSAAELVARLEAQGKATTLDLGRHRPIPTVSA